MQHLSRLRAGLRFPHEVVRNPIDFCISRFGLQYRSFVFLIVLQGIVITVFFYDV